jgi:hypothetical protein
VGEALIMTAFGLAVAIPAVLGYNALVRGNKKIINALNSFAHDLHAYFVTGARISSEKHGSDTALQLASASSPWLNLVQSMQLDVSWAVTDGQEKVGCVARSRIQVWPTSFSNCSLMKPSGAALAIGTAALTTVSLAHFVSQCWRSVIARVELSPSGVR